MNSKDILCAFSGGGFRATFFHAGVLRGLIRLGLKSKIKVISSVSGGSITNALFGLRFDDISTVEDFDQLIVIPLIEFSKGNPRNEILRHRLTSMVNSVIAFTGSLLGPIGKPLTLLGERQNSEVFIEQLDEYIFKGKSLGELSENIRIVINATNLNNGARFRFDNRDLGDYKTGYSYAVDNILISKAVMASACYPGLFSPVQLDVKHHKFFLRDKLKRDMNTPNVGLEKIYLTDGGVFDNLGYYSIKSELDRGRDGFVIISDSANRFNANTSNAFGFITALPRISNILMEQISNRDRERIVNNLLDGTWSGIYFKLENSCRWYREYASERSASKTQVPCFGWSDSVVNCIAQIRTDLNRFSEDEIKCLVYHGETLAETAIAKWHNSDYQKVKSHPDYKEASISEGTDKQMLDALVNSHKRF